MLNHRNGNNAMKTFTATTGFMLTLLLTAMQTHGSLIRTVGSSNLLQVTALGGGAATDGMSPTFPLLNTPLSVTQSNSFAQSTFDFTNNASATVIRTDFLHRRQFDGSGRAISRNLITFRVNSSSPPVTYRLSGQYQLAGERRIRFEVSLFDQTANTFLFTETHDSVNTPNESFTLGGGAFQGDFNNGFFGSLTGNLVDGHVYRFVTDALIGSFGGGSHPLSTATGFVNLTIQAVPSPSSAWIVTIGMGLLGRSRRMPVAA